MATVRHSTAHDHYYVDHGRQKTGERVFRCEGCWAGMEISDDKVTIVDGAIIWPVQ